MFFFVSLSFSLFPKIDYDIKPPLKTKIAGECGLWSLLGVATNLKSSFHFSPDNYRQNGSICHRLPTTSRNFTAEFDASVENGILTFSFTEEACPFAALTEGSKTWTGFALEMTQHRESSTQFLLKIGTIFNITQHSLCLSPSRNFTVKLVVENGTLSVFVDGNRCGQPYSFPYFYINFFSFIGSLVNDTSIREKKRIGSSDIYSFKVNIPESHHEDFSAIDMEKHARKMIANQRNMKNKLKNKVPISQLIVNNAMDSDDTLNDEMSVKELDNKIWLTMNELANRLNMTMTTSELESIIQSTIKTKLSRIEKKMNKRRQSFKNISNVLNSYVKDVEDKMGWITQYTVDEIASLKQNYKNEFTTFMKEHDPQELFDSTNRKAKEFSVSFLNFVLLMICVTEFACYLIFFFYKRKETHNFKKYD